MKITFLGGGNMANALIGGLVGKGFAANDIAVIELSAEGRERLAAAYGVRTYDALCAAALTCDVIVLAVKPQQMKAAVTPMLGQLDRQLVVSIAAGLRLEDKSVHHLGYFQPDAIVAAGLSSDIPAQPASGKITVTMSDKAKGVVLELTPTRDGDGPVAWGCTTTSDTKYVPAECRTAAGRVDQLGLDRRIDECLDADRAPQIELKGRATFVA